MSSRCIARDGTRQSPSPEQGIEWKRGCLIAGG
jgi:hypothetical protein